MSIMQVATANAKQYDWATWVMGLFRSFMSGGAASIVVATSTNLVVPNMTPARTLILMGITFLFQGIYRMCEFLALHGAPDQVQVALAEAATKQAEASDAVQNAKLAAEQQAGK